jgi:hypothetical protein
MHARLAVAVAATLLAAVTPLHGQRGGGMAEILLGTTSNGGTELVEPRIVLGPVLANAETRELLRGGFPAQLRFRLELYREGGLFYDLERAVTWDIVVAYDPGAQLYRVRRRMGSQVEDLGAYATVSSAQEALMRPHGVGLTPSRRGRRYYYSLVLDVEALSVSDLDQLERWLRGELQPAVRGDNNPATAIGNGVRTLVTRVLGGERRHYEVRSARFRN